MTSPGSPSHKARPIVAGELTFPCWLWAVKGVHAGHWIKHRDFPWEPDHFTHWHPDQLEAPTERPDDLPTTECLQGQPGDVCQHKFCQPTEIPSSSRPANEGGEHQILGTGFYRDAEPGTFGQSEWLDLLMACQDGRATCMRVLEIIEREFALKSVAADEALLAKMTDAFLKWKLPKSVLCDGCCTMRDYPHDRYGTHLLNHPEAKAMFYEVVWPLLVAAPSAPVPPPTQGAPQATVEALRTSLVECVAYLDRMGQDGVRERAYKALAMPVDSPHPQQPIAGQGEAYELLQAWGALYNTPPLVVGEEWEAMFKSVFAATCKFLARPIPPPPPATGEPPAKEGEPQSDYPTVVANWHAENASLRERLHAAKAELARAKSGGGEWCRIANDALTENETLKARLAQLEAAADAGKKDSRRLLGRDTPWPVESLLKALVIAEQRLRETGRDFDGWEAIQTAAQVAQQRLAAMSPSPAAGTEKEGA